MQASKTRVRVNIHSGEQFSWLLLQLLLVCANGFPPSLTTLPCSISSSPDVLAQDREDPRYEHGEPPSHTAR